MEWIFFCKKRKVWKKNPKIKKCTESHSFFQSQKNTSSVSKIKGLRAILYKYVLWTRHTNVRQDFISKWSECSSCVLLHVTRYLYVRIWNTNILVHVTRYLYVRMRHKHTWLAHVYTVYRTKHTGYTVLGPHKCKQVTEQTNNKFETWSLSGKFSDRDW